MFVMKSSAIIMVVVLYLSPSAMGLVVASDSSDSSDSSDDGDAPIVLPTSAAELFSDYYNNNSITKQLLARQPSYISPPSIIKLAPGMYMADNFAMGNSLWVVTPENTIVVFDVPESNEVTAELRDMMRKEPEIGNKPITYIVYTIFQGDHTFGTRSLIEDPNNKGQMPVIIGHKKLIPEAEFFDTFAFIKMNRVLRVFGTLLPKNIEITAVTPLRLGKVVYLEYYPTFLLDLKNMGDTQDVVLNGLPVKFVFIPGYTSDQMGVWFPTTRVIHGADVYYGAVPNIYTIRGEPARDAMEWSNAARVIQSYNADVLYPSHGHPIFGQERLYNLLGKTADLMQYIHDQTVRLLGKGYTPDIASRMVILPETFQSEPLLAEVYGKVEGHSKAVADRYTGWFNGEAEDLLPVSKTDFANNLVRDFGRDKIIDKAIKAYNAGDYRYSLNLATQVWRYENKPRNDALYWRSQSLKRLAEIQLPVQYRNYLLSEAMINWKVLPDAYLAAVKIRSRPTYLKLHTLKNCFSLLSVHLNAQLADGIDQTVDLSVTDDPSLKSTEVYRLRIHNSVLVVKQVEAVNTLTPTSFPLVKTTNSVLRQVLAGQITIDDALATNVVSVVTGNNTDIVSFLAKFDFVDEL